jgi:hypothetical protein
LRRTTGITVFSDVSLLLTRSSCFDLLQKQTLEGAQQRLEEARARDKQTNELLAAELKGESQAAGALRKELGQVKQELASALQVKHRASNCVLRAVFAQTRAKLVVQLWSLGKVCRKSHWEKLAVKDLGKKRALTGSDCPRPQKTLFKVPPACV